MKKRLTIAGLMLIYVGLAGLLIKDASVRLVLAIPVAAMFVIGCWRTEGTE